LIIYIPCAVSGNRILPTKNSKPLVLSLIIKPRLHISSNELLVSNVLISTQASNVNKLLLRRSYWIFNEGLLILHILISFDEVERRDNYKGIRK